MISSVSKSSVLPSVFSSRLSESAPPDLKPPRQGHWGAPVGLALVVHALLIVALTWGVSWKRDATPAVFEAELWSALPQAAAPRAVEPPPPPAPVPKPVPKPAPSPPPQPTPKAEPPAPQPAPVAAPAPSPTQADIAIAQAKKLAEAKRLEQERQETARKAAAEKAAVQKAKAEKVALEKAAEKAAEKKAAADKAALEKAAADKVALEKKRQAEKLQAEKVAAEKKAAEQKAEKAREAKEAQERQEAAAASKARDDQVRRIVGQAGATGGPQATGSAQRASGPSPGYGSRVAARIRPNVVFTDAVSGNAQAEIEVRTQPDGTITSRRLVKSSGNPAWDDAVLRAIDRTGSLPLDTDGKVPSPMIVVLRPQD